MSIRVKLILINIAILLVKFLVSNIMQKQLKDIKEECIKDYKPRGSLNKLIENRVCAVFTNIF